jgi:hypothetical protein
VFEDLDLASSGCWGFSYGLAAFFDFRIPLLSSLTVSCLGGPWWRGLNCWDWRAVLKISFVPFRKPFVILLTWVDFFDLPTGVSVPYFLSEISRADEIVLSSTSLVALASLLAFLLADPSRSSDSLTTTSKRAPLISVWVVLASSLRDASCSRTEGEG